MRGENQPCLESNSYRLVHIARQQTSGNCPGIGGIYLSRRARSNEGFVEAGCWNGGSTAKFSLICKRYGYGLHVFDSFLGVKEWDYAYAAKEMNVKNNIARYGALEVCTFHPGWFRYLGDDSSFPVRMVYIDCDVPQGTLEVLSGIMPALVEDGVIYSQDYHLRMSDL